MKHASEWHRMPTQLESQTCRVISVVTKVLRGGTVTICAPKGAICAQKNIT